MVIKFLISYKIITYDFLREKYEISRKNPASQDKKIDKSIFLVVTIPVFLRKNKNL